MTHSPDPPSPDLGHPMDIPLGASLRSSLLSGLQFLLAWAWAQLWRVGLQPKPREAKLVNSDKRAEGQKEAPLVQPLGPWPEARRAQASSGPLLWAGGWVRKEDNGGVAEGPADHESGEQEVHDGAARREKPDSRPAGRDLLMGRRTHWPGDKVNDNEDPGEEAWYETLSEALGSADGKTPSPSDSGPHRLWASARQLRGEAHERGMGETEEGDNEGGACSQSPPPVLTSPLLRAWAYRPGEEEEEDEEDVPDGEGGDEDDEDAKAEVAGRTGPGLQPFLVSIFVPGAEQPPPWSPPQLPQRLKRRLRPRRAPVEPEPEPPPGRKVRFSSTVRLHLLAVWAGPARATRRGPWEQLARDRSRFARRIAQAEAQLGPCLCPAARDRAWARLQTPTFPRVIDVTLPTPTHSSPAFLQGRGSAPSCSPAQLPSL
ncbi:protein phosphatase 1 regulatory subunit 15A [Dromiciops gliroides]|uniref:protein phosphatase 1 regulatory subunit 15A n=1 Tax=Dromiciops gliroides TaxID=33562 RepID=UPI001CC4A7EB|nr:protein phosphatase 1 regulatory subunit 15A [Dromiciops gliroides]